MNEKIDFVLLDLDMPIMDGFESCKQIFSLFQGSDMLFKLEDENPPEKRSVSNIIEDMFTQPLMVAFSGLVNDEVTSKAMKLGFDEIIEAPLTIPKI